jgi:uncharacterized lipoprotein YehR (DUF1307 family)
VRALRRPSAAVAVSLVLLLGACGGPSIAGTYENESGTLTLTEDGTWRFEIDLAGVESEFSGTYEVDGERVVFTDDDGETTAGRIVDENTIEFGGQRFDRTSA